MRELKFRAWDKKRKKYYYFPEDIISVYQTGILTVETNEGKSCRMIMPNDYEKEDFIGNKDKDDKEICEGDILRKFHKSGAYGHKGGIGVVEWSGDRFHIKLLNVKLKHTLDSRGWIFYAPDGQNFNWNELKIIGNIHEDDMGKFK